MINARYRKPPESIDRVIAKLDLRLSRLERIPRATATAVDSSNFEIKNGALRIYDSSGSLVVEIGLAQDGRYGVKVSDSSGNEIAMISQLGIEAQNSSGTIVPLNVP